MNPEPSWVKDARWRVVYHGVDYVVHDPTGLAGHWLVWPYAIRWERSRYSSLYGLLNYGGGPEKERVLRGLVRRVK